MARVLHTGRWWRIAPLAVPLVLAAVFVALALLSRTVHDQNEQRLLQQQTDQAAAAMALSVGQVRTPLDGVARAVTVAGDDPASFERLAAPLLGGGSPFDRVALFELGSPEPVATVGAGLTLTEDPARLEQLHEAGALEPFVIVDLLHAGRTLGYAVADDPSAPTRLVYAEWTLSPEPHERRRTDEAFAPIEYALYLGDTPTPDALLGASVVDLPFDGRQASAVVPFGDNELLIVTSPIGTLGSRLLHHLWWLLLGGGAVLSVAAGVLLRGLETNRGRAVSLAEVNEQISREQRDIAETLQLALLPQRLTPPPGCEVAVRYWPAGSASLIGGDFYDVFSPDSRRWVITIGDVCGHGISAAALTGLVRHTLRGSSPHTDSPADILRTIHGAIRDHDPTTFCTVCVAIFTPAASGSGGDLVVSLGGHPAPLLRRRDGSVTEVGRTGTLLGMVEPTVHDTHLPIHAGDTLVLYTDGLTDAPGDQGVPLVEVESYLHQAGGLEVGPLADGIRTLKRRRRPLLGSNDDTALVVVRFGVAASDQASTPDVALLADIPLRADPTGS